MAHLLFLHPIRPYVDKMLELNQRIEREGLNTGLINDIIQLRYRQKGWKVHWVLFGQDGNEAEPDMDLLSPLFTVAESDWVHSAQISFRRHVEEKVYPDVAVFEDIIGPPVVTVAVGGFHHGDCVLRATDWLRQLGHIAVTDKDLTEHFFWQLGDVGFPPAS